MPTSFLHLSDAPTLFSRSTHKLGSIVRSTPSIAVKSTVRLIPRRAAKDAPNGGSPSSNCSSSSLSYGAGSTLRRNKTRPAPLDLLTPSYAEHRVHLPTIFSPSTASPPSIASEFEPLSPFIATVDGTIDPRSLRSPSLWLNQTGIVEPTHHSVYPESNMARREQSTAGVSRGPSRKRTLLTFWRRSAARTGTRIGRSAHERALSFQRRHILIRRSPPSSPLQSAAYQPSSPCTTSHISDSTHRPSLVESLIQSRRGSVLASSRTYPTHSDSDTASRYSYSSASSIHSDDSSFGMELVSSLFVPLEEDQYAHVETSSTSRASTLSLHSAVASAQRRNRHMVMSDYTIVAVDLSDSDGQESIM